jgi:hypothetical protein
MQALVLSLLQGRRHQNQLAHLGRNQVKYVHKTPIRKENVQRRLGQISPRRLAFIGSIRRLRAPRF